MKFLLIILILNFSAFGQDVKYIGDKSNKRAYPVKCEEAEKVEPENRVSIFTDAELKEQGFTQTRICTFKKTPPKPIIDSKPTFMPTVLPEAKKPTRDGTPIKKMAEATKLAAIYQISARIRIAKGCKGFYAADCENYYSFYIFDDTDELKIYVLKNAETKKLYETIEGNGSMRGIFSFEVQHTKDKYSYWHWSGRLYYWTLDE
ncbi:MAG TPA: hypothetical protein VNB22_04190 [Pyrinomonadaceae bacterium]|nr:hypothetical protein [Pyrinomonadaceae bacterium]